MPELRDMLFLRLLRESYLFALNALAVNKLRTALSLLGITIGIFCIISVFTIFDSMESSIRNSINSLGDNVLFVEKWPWSMGGDYPWWKYWRRPEPKISELAEIQKKCGAAEAAAFMIQVEKTIKYRDNSVENAVVMAVSQDYDKVMSFDLSEGRYFTPLESQAGKNVAIIGSNVAENLFNKADPIGKSVKVFGRELEVIGVFSKEGNDSFGGGNDDQVMVPVNFARDLINLEHENGGAAICVKARRLVSNDELRDELTGVMRSVRKLKPYAEDDFAINEISLITKGFESLFQIIALVGWIIGGFSLLVGGFGIANIMFVSVRERTHIIGIQKSVGAKRYVILLQFLFESVFLSVFGGLFGLILIFIGTLILSYGFDMKLVLTEGNIILGIVVSAVIGLISGFVPAWSASRLDPVEAIRTGFN